VNLVILDRVGVIEEREADSASWRPLPGSLEAIARLNNAGFHVVVASNEDDLASDRAALQALESAHAALHRQLAKLGGHLDGLFFCPHGPAAGCRCHKPQPGLYLEIARRLQTELEGVWIIGDQLSDLQPAVSVGARPVLVLSGQGARQAASARAQIADLLVVPDLAGAIDRLLAQELA
jgi:D-glycero-D-manno-heptose 1,7-bisphosphate phosphatase